jgi:hypothetical protein
MTDTPRSFDQRVAPVGVGDRLRKVLTSKDNPDPLYPRLLRLRHVNPNGWQRAVLVEGTVLAGALVALADRATSWAPLILPVVTAGVVKFHDVVVGLLPSHAGDERHHRASRPGTPNGGAAREDDAAVGKRRGSS